MEEISKFPPSVAAVETAIPAFIGYTEKAEDERGNSLANVPKRITSLLQYEQYFGGAPLKSLDLNVVQSGTDITVTFDTDPGLPSQYLYYSMQLFFGNGGGPCYIVSLGGYNAAAMSPAFISGIDLLESVDEPTLLVFPDACLLDSHSSHASVVNHALAHCSKMKDRFTIADVRDARPGGTANISDVNRNFRGNLAGDIELVKYGAAYFPYLHTTLPWATNDSQIIIKSHSGVSRPITAETPLNNVNTTRYRAVYNAVKQFANTATVTVPSSGAVAGVYARVDRERGVWKAPANAGIRNVIGPAIQITRDLNHGLNIDPTSGKSVNAIRYFAGKGTLVWGARTLAGNDNENRYVPVRRFLIFAEESIKKATASFAFEPNDANTWVKVRSMIENFLTMQWRNGALAGAKPEQAFYVKIGLNQTMSAQDIRNGDMIVEIGLAVVRPAEFIVLRFSQKMQAS
jgi:hypothetical protein